MGQIIKRYVLWNNKGGVGKSTLAFHLGSLYADTHPNEKVLILDLCPQANATMTYLGGGQTGEQNLLNLQQQSETIAGFFTHQLQQIASIGTNPLNVTQFLHKASTFNRKIPENVYIVPGDGNLEVILSSVAYYANPQAQALQITNAWKNILSWVRHLCDLIASTLDGDITIFIDTNPSFALYTQQAVVAADSIIVPFNADDSSRAGIGALFGLIYGLNIPHPVYQNYNFNTLAQAAGIQLPLLQLFIGNRFTQFQGAARAFAGLASVIQHKAWEQYRNTPHNFVPSSSPITNVDDFQREYCVDLRDFNSAGVAAANHGIPLSRMYPSHYYIYGTRTQVNPNQIDACKTALNTVVAKL